MEAFPLSWPVGWPRTPENKRQQARFSRDGRPLTINAAVERLREQKRLMRLNLPVLSTNLELRRDGLPYSNQKKIDSPGAAYYFNWKGVPYCLACDKWNRVADNIAAIAAHMEALRGQNRWGVGSQEQAYAGYKRLPEPEKRNCWTVLGVKEGDREGAETNYRGLARGYHPDTAAGSHEAMAELNQAIEEVRNGGGS